MSFRPANKLTFIRRVLYTLKKDYPARVDLYRVIKTEVNPETGRRSQSRQKVEIKKAVLLPTILARKFSYDLSFIAANKNFTYGAHYDLNSRAVIIEQNDLPKGFEIKIDDYLVIENKRYEIQRSERLEFGYGYLVMAKQTEGTLPYQILDEYVIQILNMEQTVLGVK